MGCLPDNLKGKKHEDWPWPFSLIPRDWTAFCGPAPSDPNYKPVPSPGKTSSTVWPPYFATTTQDGWHFRIGARWDDVDKYYEFPSFKIGKI